MSDVSEDKPVLELVKEVALQSLNTSGQFTSDEREAIASAVAEGVEAFRQRVKENLESGARKSTVKVIADMRQRLPEGQMLGDTQLAKRLGMDLKRMREELITIEADGYIKLDRSAESWLILLTAQGQELVDKDTNS